MPQLTAVTFRDRANPPVDHVYTPKDISNGVATCIESNGVPIGNNTFSISLRQTPDGRYKATMKYAFPVVQSPVINGVSNPTVARVARATITFDFDKTSTTQERADALGLVGSSLFAGQALTDGVVRDLQNVY